MPDLQVSDSVALPVDCVVHRMAFMGTTNSGKTYAAMKCAELMWQAGLQFVALDVMGLWWGLRASSDGKGEGYPITVFGGQHGDIPVRPEDGAMLAEVVVTERISAVIDISEFEHDSEKARFAHRFAERLYWLKKKSPSGIHIFLEEAHEFIPQNPQTGDNEMLHVFNRMWKQGGNYGIGGSLISQRPQDVNKKSLGLSSCVFALNITGSNEFDAMAKWMKGVPEIAQLPNLQPGECLVWSPAWLRVKTFTKILPRTTFHPRYDPLAIPSAIDPSVRMLAPVDIEALKTRFAQVIEQAESEDPKHLQKEIAILRKQLAENRPSESAIAQQVEERTAHLVRRIDYLESFIGEGKSEVEAVYRQVSNLHARFQFGDAAVEESYRKPEPVAVAAPVQRPETEAQPATEPIKKSARVITGEPESGLTRSQTSIGQTLANLKALGKNSADRRLVAALSGQSHKSGSYGQNLAELRRRELIETTGEGLGLTAAGCQRFHSEKPPTLANLHQAWFDQLTTTQARMLKSIIALHPKTVSRDELARLTNQSPISGSFGQNLARLRALGLIAGSKALGATTLVFPGGLK